MDLHIYKDKLRKGKSYAFRSSILQNALDEAGIDMCVQLQFIKDSNSFHAKYILAGPYDDTERFLLSVGCVNSSDAKITRIYMEMEVIPEFVEWAKIMISLLAESTQLSLERFWDGPNFNRTFKKSKSE